MHTGLKLAELIHTRVQHCYSASSDCWMVVPRICCAFSLDFPEALPVYHELKYRRRYLRWRVKDRRAVDLNCSSKLKQPGDHIPCVLNIFNLNKSDNMDETRLGPPFALRLTNFTFLNNQFGSLLCFWYKSSYPLWALACTSLGTCLHLRG